MFLKVKSEDAIQCIVALAAEIWHQHFTPLIGIEQVEYMLNNFQSCKAVTKQIKDDNFSYFLVKDTNETLGYLAYYPTLNYLYLSKFYLKKNARGKGIAKKMLSFLEDKALTLNLPAIQLNVFKGNNDTIDIYKKLGFEIVDTVQIDIGNGFTLDDYVMNKKLKSKTL